MTTVPTYTATIYVGFRIGRSDEPSPGIHAIDAATDICQTYCDEVGLCVTVTPTTFVYTKGRERGAAIGLINYPRFPSSSEKIREHALTLAKQLKERLHQWKVSIVFPGKTVMIGDEPEATGAPTS